MMHKRNRQQGFTIVELIVTLGILGLMLFLVNRLFNDTSLAVTTSVQNSKTIAANRSINEQITIDADNMIGPSADTTNDEPGYIVILQQRLNNVLMIDPRNLSTSTVPELRSDQVVFIRDAEGLRSMTPQGDSSYRSNFIGLAGDRAKVWYGHALRSKPDGDRIGTDADQQLGGANAGFDSVGSNFILGRQAMLFNPTNSETNNSLITNFANVTYARQPWQLSRVDNTAYPHSGRDRAYMGLSDITLWRYGPSTGNNTLLGALTNGVLDSNGDYGTTNLDTSDYLNTLYTYPSAETVRLRVNTSPDPEETDYATWAIAQGHPILAQNCSEIIVDFAADLNGNGRIDRRDFGGTADDDIGAIWWYDALRQSDLGTTATGVWRNQTSQPAQPYVNITGDKKAFVFRVDDARSFADAGGILGTPGTDHSYWPYLIRIRYRLHDTRGRLTSNYDEPNVDNNGDGNVDENDDAKISGRWFERIIRVNRP
jgi:prepilin-type N-terminal cleavage/methylation domain-containing protein